MTEQLKPGAFRVFDTETKEYKDPDEYWMNGRGVLKILYYGDVEPDVPGAADAGPRWIAERWTGLHDRDGKPVYEGDKLYSSTYGFQAFFWDKHSATWYTDIKRPWYVTLAKLLEKDCVVVGTIHDSPETLAAAAKAVSQ